MCLGCTSSAIGVVAGVRRIHLRALGFFCHAHSSLCTSTSHPFSFSRTLPLRTPLLSVLPRHNIAVSCPTTTKTTTIKPLRRRQPPPPPPAGGGRHGFSAGDPERPVRSTSTTRGTVNSGMGYYPKVYCLVRKVGESIVLPASSRPSFLPSRSRPRESLDSGMRRFLFLFLKRHAAVLCDNTVQRAAS